MNLLDGSPQVEPAPSALFLGSDALVGHTVPLPRYEVCENTEQEELINDPLL